MASYCYYDSTGNLLEFITQAPQRNGDDGDKVYVHIEGLTPTVLQMYWKNSAGTTGNTNITSTLTTAQVPYDQYRDLEYFQYYTDYTFYVFTAPTSVAGLFTMTPYADTKAFDPYNVTVQDNTIALDSSMTASNYAYLLSQVKQGVSSCQAKIGTPVKQVAFASDRFTKKSLAGDLYEYSYALPAPLATNAFGFPAVWAIQGGEYAATGQGYYNRSTNLLVLTFPVNFTLSSSITFLFDYWYNS